MIEDVVVIERAELERIKARSRAWKRSASQWRRSSGLQSMFREEWYQAYRRCWGLDEPTTVLGARPLMGALYDFGRWVKRLFCTCEAQPDEQQ